MEEHSVEYWLKLKFYFSSFGWVSSKEQKETIETYVLLMNIVYLHFGPEKYSQERALYIKQCNCNKASIIALKLLFCTWGNKHTTRDKYCYTCIRYDMLIWIILLHYYMCIMKWCLYFSRNYSATCGIILFATIV